jgi:two-component system, NarL family, nitrate/nitrite response regulator NarL
MLARPIRVLLVGGYRVALLGLEKLILGQRPGMQVAAMATSCELACKLAAEASPDVVVIDPEQDCESASEFIPILVRDHSTRVLVLVGQRDEKIRESFVLCGASGVVKKDDSPETLVKAIEKVHGGELWLDRSTIGKLFVELSRQKSGASADPEKRKLATLTRREQDVVRKLVTEPGADNKKLAISLYIGEHTLRNHLSRIYDKLGVPNRLELYVFARRNGLNGYGQPLTGR